jgi:hypothetical protein
MANEKAGRWMPSSGPVPSQANITAARVVKEVAEFQELCQLALAFAPVNLTLALARRNIALEAEEAARSGISPLPELSKRCKTVFLPSMGANPDNRAHLFSSVPSNASSRIPGASSFLERIKAT